VAAGRKEDSVSKTEAIIEQIRRIRNLAENAATEGEAAAAAAAMQRLLQKYNLDLAEIPAGVPDDLRDEPVDDETIQVQTKQNDWRWSEELLRPIATYNFCRVIGTTVYDAKATKERMSKAAAKGIDSWRVNSVYRRALIIVGQPHNREVVKYLYEVLTQTLERLGKAHSTKSTEEGEDIGGGRKAYRFSPRRAFYYGAVEVLTERLAKEWQSFQRTERIIDQFDPLLGTTVARREIVRNDKAIALVRGSQAKIDLFVKSKYTLTRGRSIGREAAGADPTNAYSSYQAGRDAGRSIPLQRGLGGGGSTPIRQLGEGKR
jgi:hypothetical protein